MLLAKSNHAQFVQMPHFSWANPVLEGWLWKEGKTLLYVLPTSRGPIETYCSYRPDHITLANVGSVVKSWKRRWFVMKDRRLYYFKKDVSTGVCRT